MRKILISIELGMAGSFGVIVTQCITHEISDWICTAIIAGGAAFVGTFFGYSIAQKDTKLKSNKQKNT